MKLLLLYLKSTPVSAKFVGIENGEKKFLLLQHHLNQTITSKLNV